MSHVQVSVSKMNSFPLDVIYRGLLLREDRTLESYGLKNNATVYIIYKEPAVEGNIPPPCQNIEALHPYPPHLEIQDPS